MGEPTETLRALLQSFLVSLTGGGKNNPRTLSINHDQLAELVAETRHVLAAAIPPEQDGYSEGRGQSALFGKAHDLAMRATDMTALHLADRIYALATDRHAEGRIAGLEEAAKIAEDAVTYVVGEQRDLCDRIATAIRSTKANGETA